MTETDLVTAGDSTENDKLSNSVTPDTSADPDASGSVADTSASPSDGSLSTMVLPELRALANRAGVKGT
ncbi:MAG: transcription termination factor Rho, partial [Mycobacterium sp.]